MKTVHIDAQQRLHWCEAPEPELHENEVLIEIAAAALNRADILQKQGKYPPPPGAPEWMGLEVSGVIQAVGGAVVGFAEGERVCALLGGGGYAERVAVRAENVIKLPAGLSMVEAAAVPEAYATAYLNLFREAGLRRGEVVLIHAGASGVGIAATQLAKAAGAEVLVTVRSREKLEAVQKIGADRVICSREESVSAVMEEYAAAGKPVNVVLDCVGGAQLGECFPHMARYGRWVMIATLGGTATQLELRPLLTKGLRLIGSTLRSRTIEQKGEILRELEQHVLPEMAAGRFRPVIDSVFPVERVEDAQSVLEHNANIGKVVLQIKKECV